MASTYTWTLESGTIPPGTTLSLSDIDLDITLTGTPTTAGTYSFTVRVTNDISAAFDDQAYSITISETAIQITPDLGLPIAEMFNSSNSKMVTLQKIDMTDVTGQDVSTTYVPVRKMRFSVELGDGVKTYEAGDVLASNINTLTRRYLWRSNITPTVIHEVIIV